MPFISLLTRAMIGGGTPVGAASANQPAKSKPGKVSATAGTSGNSGSRFERRHRERAELAGRDMALGGRDGDDEELHAAGEHVLNALRHLGVGHVGDVACRRAC